jgi:hypothetical protein
MKFTAVGYGCGLHSSAVEERAVMVTSKHAMVVLRAHSMWRIFCLNLNRNLKMDFLHGAGELIPSYIPDLAVTEP